MAPSMDISSNSSWRTGLPQDFRQNIFKPVMDTLERTMNPMEELSISRELLKSAWRFEEEMFHAATDRQDYLRKMSSFDTRAQATPANAMQGRLGGAQGVVKSLDPGATLPMQNGAQNLSNVVRLPSQVSSQDQQRQEVLAQSFQSNLAANIMQSSSGLGSNLSGFTGIAPQERLPQQGALSPQQPIIYDQQQHQKLRVFPESWTASAELSSHSGTIVDFDHRESVWEKLQVLKDKYLEDTLELHDILATRIAMKNSPEQSQRLKNYKRVLRDMIAYLRVPKESMPWTFSQEIVEAFEKQIVEIMEKCKCYRQQRQQQQFQQQEQKLQAQMQSHQLFEHTQQLPDSSSSDAIKGDDNLKAEQVAVKVFLKRQHQLKQHQMFQQDLLRQQQEAQQQQQLKPGSPQMTSEHLSSRTDHQNFTEPLQVPKVGSPLQAATLPLKTPSPSMLLGASLPLYEGIDVKIAAYATATTGSAQTFQYSVETPNNLGGIGTPGPSLSVDFCPSPAAMGVPQDEVHALSHGTPLVDKTNLDPVDRLVANIYSIRAKVLSSAVQEMIAFIRCDDKLGASAPGNGSRAAVREDLASATKARVQAKVWTTQDSDSPVRKKSRYMDSAALSLVSSDGSVANSLHRAEGFDALQTDSMINSNLRIPRMKVPLSVREEVRQINCCLIDTEVAVSEEGTEEASAHGKEGIVVTCSYKGVAVSPSLAQNTMISFPHLLVIIPPSYPLSSPTYNFDDMAPNSSFPVASAARDEFVREVGYLIAPVTLKAIAACWDRCARNVLAEFARHHGGGTLSTSFGVWENYVIPDP